MGICNLVYLNHCQNGQYTEDVWTKSKVVSNLQDVVEALYVCMRLFYAGTYLDSRDMGNRRVWWGSWDRI